jgi:hypothetical protein
MTYDEADGYVLFFGGSSGSYALQYYGDTWKFLHGTWTALHPSNSPSPRAGASMAYDQADGYVVLFGGGNRTTEFGDTWSFAAGSWSLIASAGGPPFRFEAPMTYDAADGYLLLYGGYSNNDTWSYVGGTWTNVTPSVSPEAPAIGVQMTYDSEDGYVLLYSGQQHVSAHAFVSNTWTWSAGVWTNITGTLAVHPPPLQYGMMVDDTYDGYVVLYGGENDTFQTQNTTWAFVNGAWSLLHPATTAGRIFHAGSAFDPVDNEVVVFGGQPFYLGTLGGTWVY